MYKPKYSSYKQIKAKESTKVIVKEILYTIALLPFVYVISVVILSI